MYSNYILISETYQYMKYKELIMDEIFSKIKPT